MSLSVQFLSLLAMIGTGILAGAFMDLVGTGVDASGKRSIIRKYGVLLEFIGWIIVGGASFYVLFLVRDGAWRMYDPVAQVCGMLLYASIFYRPFRFFGRLVNMLVIKPIVFMIMLVVRLVRGVFRILFKVLLFVAKPFFFLYDKIYESLFKTSPK